MIKKGSYVHTIQGIDKVQSINTTTYSIPVYTILLTEGGHAGETIATPRVAEYHRGGEKE